MTSFRRMAAAAAVVATMGVAIIGAAPAAAQGWYDPDYPHAERQLHDGSYVRRAPWGYQDYGVDAGITDIAICPPGYHLGHTPGLCWPNR